MTTATKAEMIAAVRSHAFANYEKGGWDILVECWGDEDIANVIEGAKTAKAAIAACKRNLRTLDEYRSDMIATADW